MAGFDPSMYGGSRQNDFLHHGVDRENPEYASFPSSPPATRYGGFSPPGHELVPPAVVENDGQYRWTGAGAGRSADNRTMISSSRWSVQSTAAPAPLYPDTHRFAPDVSSGFGVFNSHPNSSILPYHIPPQSPHEYSSANYTSGLSYESFHDTQSPAGPPNTALSQSSRWHAPIAPASGYGEGHSSVGPRIVKEVVASDNVKDASHRRRLSTDPELLYHCEEVPHCTSTFTTLHNLKNHIKSHRGEKEHQCDYCNYESVTKSDVRRHMRTCRYRSGTSSEDAPTLS